MKTLQYKATYIKETNVKHLSEQVLVKSSGHMGEYFSVGNLIGT